MFIPGIFIPGMVPICCFVVDCLRRAARLFRPDCLCIADIFIPGMFMPGMFAMLCFLAGCFFRPTLLFLGAAVDVDFGIFIPGMFCMS